MRYDARTVDIPSAGSRVQILDSSEKVRWIRFTARQGNSGGVYVGDSNVSATRGRELRPPETSNGYDAMTQTVYAPWQEAGGTVPMSSFYVDADTNGNDVDYEVLYQ
jgi:hypothetical protein